MIFRSKRPVSGLISWCRAVKHGLHVGLPLPKVMKQQAKSGPESLRTTSLRIAERLEEGDSLADAIAIHRDRFPPLMVELVKVGETGGKLTEVFAELESYFEHVQTARRTFLRALAWPAFMYVALFVILALVAFILGQLLPPGLAYDPIGFGLTGTWGAIKILFFGTCLGMALYAAYFAANESDEFKGFIEAKVLPIPGVGGCARACALHRFSLAYSITEEAGLRADKSTSASLKATTNQAYTQHADRVGKKIKKGAEVAETLEECGPSLFPSEYIQIVRIGEDTGQLAEVMAKQAKHYGEEAAWKMKWLSMIAGGMVYLAMAIIVIMMVVRMFNNAIMNPMNELIDATSDPDKFLRGGNGW
jgi:type IV pilus assembly protein PilC